MVPDQTCLLIGTVLLIHGLGHGGALGALIWLRALPDGPTGGWRPARSWLFPAARPSATTNMAMAFWGAAMVGFVLAGLSFWGVLIPADIGRVIGVGSALVSLTGMLLFFGTWPAVNWVASLALNIAVFVTQFVTQWPPPEMIGN